MVVACEAVIIAWEAVGVAWEVFFVAWAAVIITSEAAHDDFCVTTVFAGRYSCKTLL